MGAGYLASSVAAGVDHELLRNLLLNANAGYENDFFQGVSRTDAVFSAGAGIRYLLNRNLYLGSGALPTEPRPAPLTRKAS